MPAQNAPHRVRVVLFCVTRKTNTKKTRPVASAEQCSGGFCRAHAKVMSSPRTERTQRDNNKKNREAFRFMLWHNEQKGLRTNVTVAQCSARPRSRNCANIWRVMMLIYDANIMRVCVCPGRRARRGQCGHREFIARTHLRCGEAWTNGRVSEHTHVCVCICPLRSAELADRIRPS